MYPETISICNKGLGLRAQKNFKPGSWEKINARSRDEQQNSRPGLKGELQLESLKKYPG